MESLTASQTTPTIDAQRDVELTLLHFLKKYNPHVYSIWRSHPDLEPEDLVLRADNDGVLPVMAEESGGDAVERVRAWTRRQVAPQFTSPVPLLRRFHVEYLSRQLGGLSPAAQGLYPSRPWLAYWSLQASDLLGVTSTLFEITPAKGLVELLLSCLVVSDCPNYVAEYREGHTTHAAAAAASGTPRSGRKPVVGFAGGPAHQMAHMVSAYAAVAALALLHSFHPCLHRLPRAAIKRWLLSLRTAEGGFCVHHGGESDMRASYAASVITTLLRLDEPDTFPADITSEVDGSHPANAALNDCAGIYARLHVSEENGFDLSGYDDIRHVPVLNEVTARYVAGKQTYEGGFMCDTFSSEAHGAYTQTAMASLLLMKQPQMVHQPRLRRWLAERQLSFEGGFNGRTNKLVDSCYSHWVGSSHIMLEAAGSYSKLLGCDLAARARRHEKEEAEEKAARHREGGDANHNGFSSTSQPGSPCVNGQREAKADGSREGNEEDGGFLLAKELFLLDHVQLVNLSMVTCEDDEQWDKAEAAERKAANLVDQFLAADDAPRRAALAHRATKIEVFRRLHKQECLMGKNLPYTEENVAAEVEQLHKDVAFMYAPVGDYAYNQRKLQQYVLRCCQCWQDGEGGLMDKPECSNDAYHTCYSLSGMSGAQNLQYLTHASNPTGSAYIERAMEKDYVPGKQDQYGAVLGVEGPSVGAEVSVLRSTNPVINLHRSRIVNALSTWGPKAFI